MTSFYDFTLKTLEGRDLALASFRGKAVLVVNVASRCGYTPQYEGLEALSKAHKDLVVLGVPANEFGAQEPGSDAEIKAFCESRYGVSFLMASKLVVKGDTQHPLFAWLTASAAPPGDIQWNFEKFLIDRAGRVVGRFRSGVTPTSAELGAAIAKALEPAT